MIRLPNVELKSACLKPTPVCFNFVNRLCLPALIITVIQMINLMKVTAAGNFPSHLIPPTFEEGIVTTPRSQARLRGESLS